MTFNGTGPEGSDLCPLIHGTMNKVFDLENLFEIYVAIIFIYEKETATLHEILSHQSARHRQL